jgi:hypothetical protein
VGPKTFKAIVDHLFPIRKEFFAQRPSGGSRDFDYPDYGGLPKRISNRLSSEAVDALQSILDMKFLNKRDFAKTYKQSLKDLGEPGKY